MKTIEINEKISSFTPPLFIPGEINRNENTFIPGIYDGKICR